MNFYADSNYIHARICGLHSMLLAERDYREIVKNRNFQSILPLIDSNNIRNDFITIKEKIFRIQADDVISMACACARYRKVFLRFLRYFEILNLKLICAKAFGRDPAPFMWYDIGESAVLERGMLSAVNGTASIAEYTAGTWMDGLVVSGDNITFEEIEYSIDRAALGIALEFPLSVRFSRRSDSMKAASGLAAYFSISWSRRLRQIYGWDEEWIGKYIESNMPVLYGSRSMTRQVGEWTSRLGKLVPGGRDLTADERAMERILLRSFSKMFHENFHSINTVTCYLALLYRQIRNLFSIAEGLRSGLAADVIMENVICEA